MLMLGRNVNESVIIEIPGSKETIKVLVIEQRPGKLRLGFDCPSEFKVFREEVFESRQNGNIHPPSYYRELRRKLANQSPTS